MIYFLYQSYSGWGCEDDDFRGRLVEFGKFEINRPNQEFFKYRMIKHQTLKEKNTYRPNVQRLRQKGFLTPRNDGLNVSIFNLLLSL